ncbi:MAG TPA: hypothetical protein VK680_11690 [Solirubrobacteraceae bacterium]|nr:hypothetical protein [Solirubrobacteraceae bacterium]
MLLVSAAYTASTASADVDMTGRLEKVVSLQASPGEVKPLATSANGEYRCVDPYSPVGNWFYYFAIGNCASGWDLEVVSYASENTVTHEHSYGGYINNAFSGCGWIDTAYPIEKLNSTKYSACAGSGSSREFKVEESSFMEKYNRGTVGDGNYVVNKIPCPEYANYRPWSSSNVEKELIRTAPAYAAKSPGSELPALKWRYVTKYASTDGTGKYAMVRDDRINGAEGNWVFVPRSCLPATLPENGDERLPPPPPTRIGIINNEGDSYVKEGALNAPYEFEGAGKSIALSGNRIGLINLEGDSYVKEGALNAPYEFEAAGTAIALSGNRIALINNEGDAYVKEGALNAPYEFEGIAKSIALSGNRIGIINLEGDSYVKEGALNAPYEFEGTAKSIALAE